jgi:hypothetical protein
VQQQLQRQEQKRNAGVLRFAQNDKQKVNREGKDEVWVLRFAQNDAGF